MTLRVTVVDEQTGDTDTTTVADGDYLIVAHDPCRVDSTMVYKHGATHVITVKDRITDGSRLAPE